MKDEAQIMQGLTVYHEYKGNIFFLVLAVEASCSYHTTEPHGCLKTSALAKGRHLSDAGIFSPCELWSLDK